MRASMMCGDNPVGARRAIKGLVAAMVGAVALGLFSVGAAAGDDHRSKHRRHDSWKHERHRDHRWDDADRFERSGDRRKHRRYYSHSHYHEPSWRYYEGRHWKSPHYRGRRCDDHRHHRDVHYHVLARDYYDYYYPRYRYYGPAPLHADASVIITLPLF